jgi:hypothetical protein
MKCAQSLNSDYSSAANVTAVLGFSDSFYLLSPISFYYYSIKNLYLYGFVF